MSVLEMISSHEEDWIKKFDPQKRILTGAAYFLIKRVLDLVLVVITLPFWLPLNAVIALIIRITSPGEPVFSHKCVQEKAAVAFTCTSFEPWCQTQKN